MDLRQHLSRFFSDKDLLDRDQGSFEQLIVRVELHLLFQFLYEHLTLSNIHSSAEIVQHEVVVQEHVEHQVAIIFGQNLVVDHFKLLLSFLEKFCSFCLSLLYLSECHSVREQSLVGDERSFSVDCFRKVVSLLGDFNGLLESCLVS